MKTKLTHLVEATIMPSIVMGGVQKKEYSLINTKQQPMDAAVAQFKSGQQLANSIMGGINRTAAEMASADLANRVRTGGINIPKPSGEFSPIATQPQPMDAAVAQFKSNQAATNLANRALNLGIQKPEFSPIQTNKPQPIKPLKPGEKPGEAGLMSGEDSKLETYLHSRMSQGQYDKWKNEGLSHQQMLERIQKLRSNAKNISLQKPEGVSQEDWNKLDSQRQAEYYKLNPVKSAQKSSTPQGSNLRGDLTAAGEEARRQERVRTGGEDHVIQPGEVVKSSAVGIGAARNNTLTSGANWGQSVQTKYTGYYQWPHPKAGMPISAKDKEGLKDRGIAESIRFNTNSLKVLLNDAWDPKNPYGSMFPQVPQKPAPVTPAGPYVPTPGGVKPKNPKVVTPKVAKPKTGVVTSKSGAGGAAGGNAPAVSGDSSELMKTGKQISDWTWGKVKEYGKAGATVLSLPPEELAATISGRLAGKGFTKTGLQNRLSWYDTLLGAANPLQWTASAAQAGINMRNQARRQMGLSPFGDVVGAAAQGAANIAQRTASATTREGSNLMAAALYDPRSLAYTK